MLITLPADSPAKLSILAYAGIFALAVMLLYLMILVPSLLPNKARPEDIGRSLFCYLMEGIGVAIMSVSGLTAVIGVLAGIPAPAFSYLLLLLVFGAGGVIFLRYESRQRIIDPNAQIIPSLLFRYTVKLVGVASGLLGGFSLISFLFFRPIGIAPRWWVNPLVMLIYGCFLVWVTRQRRVEEEMLMDPFGAKRKKK